jgi:hypothetical protein
LADAPDEALIAYEIIPQALEEIMEILVYPPEFAEE